MQLRCLQHPSPLLLSKRLASAAGGISSTEPPPNPCSAWLSNKLWGELVRLSSGVKGFDGLEAAFHQDQDAFKVCSEQLNTDQVEVSMS
jgi:hypothetical protein